MIILDTHTLIWYLTDSEKLSDELKEMINREAEAAVSIVSLWEIAIKQSIGKLEFDLTPSEIEGLCSYKNIRILFFDEKDLEILKTLPQIHGDPFDRLIISQAIKNGSIVVTRDSIIPRYPVRTMWDIRQN